MANYSEQSPYSKTSIQGDYLDIMKHRTVALDETDEAYTIESKYSMRPDLLAYDRYKNS